MRVVRTWDDNRNDVIRKKLFTDTELLDLMLIPENARGNLREFITRYFADIPMSDELVIDEPVRVLHQDLESVDFGHPKVHKRYWAFDIYVKEERLYDADADRMRMRTRRIAQKLKELLTDEKLICQLSFAYADDYSMACKLIGYRRHRIVFTYKTTS